MSTVTMNDATAVAAASAPVHRTERIGTIDVLRGFALLGILAVNIEGFAGPESMHDVPLGMARPAFTGWHANLDFIILALKWIFVEGKMRGLFAALFGAGTVLLTERLEKKQVPPADVFLRRNMWLLLFGLLHGMFIWDGDILTFYSLSGLLLLYPLRHVSSRVLISVGLVMSLVIGSFGLTNATHAMTRIRAGEVLQQAKSDVAAGRPLTAQETTALHDAEKGKAEEAEHIKKKIAKNTAPYLSGLAERASDFIDGVDALFRSGYIMEIMGMMLFGMGLYKTGFLAGRLSSKTYWTVAALCYGCSVPAILYGLFVFRSSGYAPGVGVRWLYLPYEFMQAIIVPANVSLVVLATRTKIFTAVTRALAMVGQTAFTNYIGTSLLCQTIFVWSPLKLYGKLEYYQELYVVAAVWALNLGMSSLWMSRFQYGPLEWCWRSLTYWRVQNIRRNTSPANALLTHEVVRS